MSVIQIMSNDTHVRGHATGRIACSMAMEKLELAKHGYQYPGTMPV